MKVSRLQRHFTFPIALLAGVQLGAGEEWKTDDGLRFFTYYQPDELESLVARAGFRVDASWEVSAEYVVWIYLVALAV